jgi:hypothetical protein
MRSGQLPKVLWLAWVGQALLSLDETWLTYLRRFAIDH